ALLTPASRLSRIVRGAPWSSLFPYTTLFRSVLPVVWWCLQSCQELLDLVHDVWARVCTDEDVASLAVTVKAERRNRCHSGCCDRFGIGIGIDLDDLDSSFVFVGELIEYRCDLFARSTPRRPDVDDYGDVGIDDLGGECGVCDFRRTHAGTSNSVSVWDIAGAAERKCWASMAAEQPVPAAVIACRYRLSTRSPAANTPS